MKTVSVQIQNLCVPCACRCRHCLLSWDGKTVGIPWERSLAFAARFRDWQREHRPELDFGFCFGYSMEHPQLQTALRQLRALGSPQAEFLQCDGMAMRTEAEGRELARMLAREGVKALNFTFYGLAEYHDRFAARSGEFDLLLRMAQAAAEAGLARSAGIALTEDNVRQADVLAEKLRDAGIDDLRLFVPHEEGRGAALDAARLRQRSFQRLSEETQSLLNPAVYRPEREWLAADCFAGETRRSLLISLRADNIDRYEAMDFAALIGEAEALDEAYYNAFPTFAELAERYGAPESDRIFRRRDLFYHYRRRYAEEFGVSVYDVTDERQTGSRRS